MDRYTVALAIMTTLLPHVPVNARRRLLREAFVLADDFMIHGAFTDLKFEDDVPAPRVKSGKCLAGYRMHRWGSDMKCMRCGAACGREVYERTRREQRIRQRLNGRAALQ